MQIKAVSAGAEIITMGYIGSAANSSSIHVDMTQTVIYSVTATHLDNLTINDTNLLQPEVTIPDSFIVTVCKTVAMVMIMVAAIFGNFLVITSVLKFERLRIIANSFLVSLAFADLLVAILVMPFNASQEIAGKWVFGRVVCDIFNANDVLFSTASLLHLCCISMDRYIAIMDPFHYEFKMTKRRVVVMLCCAWGASALISHIPIHVGWYTTDVQRNILELNTDECSFKVNKVYAVISSCISFWLPATIMVFTYVKIYRAALRQERQIQVLVKASEPTLQHLNEEVSNGRSYNDARASENQRLKQERRKLRREHKAAKTLGIIMGAFLFCWLPFFLWYVATTMCDSCKSPNVLVGILFWIGYANSALNPIIYAFFNRDFRHAFKKLLRCAPANNWTSSADVQCCSQASVRRGEPYTLNEVNRHTQPRPSFNSSSQTPSPHRIHKSYNSVE